MKKNLKDLRKSKNMSQNELAEKLSVPVATVRKWERVEALPSIQDISSLAKVLEIQNEDIISIFRTEPTLVEKNNLREIESYEILEKLFWGTDNTNKFIKFFSLLCHMNIKGTIYSEKYLFPFSRIIAKSDSDGVVIADGYNNLIVFTYNNVKSVAPLSANFDVYIFEMELFCSIFPLCNKDYTSDIGDSKIKISVYCR